MKFKKFFSIFLSCALLLSSFGITTLAAEDVISITTGTAISANGSYRLDNNISDRISVASGITATLDLNGHNIDTTNTSNSAIYNEGTLTINGIGTVTGKNHGIYNGGNITINSGNFNGKNYQGINTGSDAVTTINGGTFTGNENGIYNNGDLTINGGTFTGSYCGLDNYLNAEINGGTYISTDFDISNSGTISGSLEKSSFKSCYGLTFTHGTYTGITKLQAAKFPQSSTASIALNNARNFNAEIEEGSQCSFSGTVANDANVNLTKVKGGAFTKALKDSIESSTNQFSKKTLPTGYVFKDDSSEGFNVINAGTISVTVQTADSTKGSLSCIYINGSSSGSVNPSTDRSQSRTLSVTRGSVFSLTGTQYTAWDGYEFKGWYTNAEGTGIPIDPDNYTTPTDVNTITIYAVFGATEETKTFEEQAAAWANGTEFTISNTDELAYFAYAVNTLGTNFKDKTVALTADLDLKNAAIEPIGTNAHKFSGIFDGQNHTISSFTATADAGAGLFGYTNGGEIKNLTVRNCQVTATANGTSTPAAGSIAGWTNGTVITNCTAANSTLSAWFTGGIVGHIINGTINNCTADNIAGGSKFGGIVGYTEGCSISNAAVSNIAAADAMQGAIIGHACAGTTKIINAKVVAAAIPVIGSIYAENSFSLEISGENTDITASTIVAEGTANKPVIIDGGRYAVDSIIANDAEKTNDVTITSGVFTCRIPSEYCSDEAGESANTDENTSNDYPYTIGKNYLKWYYATDSGYFMNGESRIGIMRFLFNLDNKTGKTIKNTGIAYYSDEGSITGVNAPQSGTETAFYGDVTGENISACYAKAYIIWEGGETVWSDTLSCNPNFIRHFKALDGTTESEVIK